MVQELRDEEKEDEKDGEDGEDGWRMIRQTADGEV